MAAEAKTKPTTETLDSYLARVPDPDRRKDCAVVAKMMEEITGEKAVIWGPGIVGFGLYRYKYASGHSGDWPVAGFAARKTDLTLYVMPGNHTIVPLLRNLGKHKASKACLYIKKLSDVDMPTLRQIVQNSVDAMSAVRVWPDNAEVAATAPAKSPAKSPVKSPAKKSAKKSTGKAAKTTIKAAAKKTTKKAAKKR